MYDITNEELTSVQKWVVDVVCGTNYITVVDVVAKTCYCTFQRYFTFTAVATQYWKLSVGRRIEFRVWFRKAHNCAFIARGNTHNFRVSTSQTQTSTHNTIHSRKGERVDVYIVRGREECTQDM